MEAMIARFIRLEACVRGALMAAGSSVRFSEQDIKDLKNLCSVLSPAKKAVDRLNQRDATLLSAERINKIVFNHLEAMDKETDPKKQNPFAATFKEILMMKIEGRRPANLIHLMEYLRDSNYVKKTLVDPFGIKPKKTEIYKLATELLGRLFSIEDTDENQGQNATCFILSLLK